LLGLGIAGGVWFLLPQRSLAADVVAHMAGEPDAWQRTDVPVPNLELNAVLLEAKLRLKPEAGIVSYASSCDFRGHKVPHLVVQTQSGPVTVMVLEIVVSQQDLGNRKTESAKKFFVSGHEPGLADRSAGLQLRQIVWPLLMSERAHARANRARGDQHDFPAGVALGRDLRHQLLHLREVRLFPVVGQDTGAQFNYDAGDIFEQLRTHAEVITNPAHGVEAVCPRGY